MIYIHLCCLQMERLVMELTRLMNADIIHQIYHQMQVGEYITVRGYENDGQRNCEFTFKISQIILLRSHR
jgi:hypothetical protein